MSRRNLVENNLITAGKIVLFFKVITNKIAMDNSITLVLGIIKCIPTMDFFLLFILLKSSLT